MSEWAARAVCTDYRIMPRNQFGDRTRIENIPPNDREFRVGLRHFCRVADDRGDIMPSAQRLGQNSRTNHSRSAEQCDSHKITLGLLRANLFAASKAKYDTPR